MPDLECTVLDHVNKITVPGNVFAQPANEYWALVCLWHGLEFLYHQTAKCDDFARQLINPEGKLTGFSWGNIPSLSKIPTPLLTCAFHWYAVSACQYVRTVGAIAYKHDQCRPKPLPYVKAVIPEVLAFRNKVAAHFAWSNEDNRDNDAERLASVLPPITFLDDSFHVGVLGVYIRHGDKTSQSDSLQPWSICKVHDQLRKRYWPELVPSQGQEVK